jgi:DNA-binding IclR family transcriptional regulator
MKKSTMTLATKINSDAKDRQFVTALARGLCILRCFSAEQPSLGTAAIARMTGLAQPTVWRLCHTLVIEGYLVQMDSDKLRLGIPVLSLGYSAIAATPLAELARTDMLAIAVRHQGAVSLGIPDGESMVYLQRCQGSQIVLRDMSVGSRVPVLTSVTGWAWLAGLAPELRQQALAQLRAGDPKIYSAMLPKIELALKEYEAVGYVINKGSMHSQINAVGVPVISDDGCTVLALSSGGLSQLFDDATLNALGIELKKLAVQLSAALTAQQHL